GGGQRGGRVAVAVAVRAAGDGHIGPVLALVPGAVAVVAGAARRVRLQHRVGDLERVRDQRAARRQLTEPGEFQEAVVDDGPLVGVDAAVAEVVDDGGVRVAGLGQPEEIRLAGVRAVGGDRPFDHVPLVVVGGGGV